MGPARGCEHPVEYLAVRFYYKYIYIVGREWSRDEVDAPTLCGNSGYVTRLSMGDIGVETALATCVDVAAEFVVSCGAVSPAFRSLALTCLRSTLVATRAQSRRRPGLSAVHGV